MPLKDEIDNQYRNLLTLAQEHDACFELQPEEGFGARSSSVKEEDSSKYWETRGKLESGLAEWMSFLRKSFDTIPLSERKFRIETRTDYGTGDTFTIKEYDSEEFSSLIGFFDKIKQEVEGHNGILAKVQNSRPIHSQLRNIRGDVLSFSHSVDLFVPAKMMTIEQQVEIIFRLRELGLEKAAEEIEGIDEEEDNRLKCLKARTALEQIVLDYCEKQGVTPTSFFYNLLSAIEKGMTKKEQRKSIAAHYSFVSKIVHKEIEANPKNTQYAVYGIFNIIGSLVLKKEKLKKENLSN